MFKVGDKVRLKEYEKLKDCEYIGICMADLERYAESVMKVTEVFNAEGILRGYKLDDDVGYIWSEDMLERYEEV